MFGDDQDPIVDFKIDEIKKEQIREFVEKTQKKMRKDGDFDDYKEL